jgi:uncharacterized protein (TIGR02145 family)
MNTQPNRKGRVSLPLTLTAALAVALALTVISCSKNEKCGNKEYNTKTHFCYNGKVEVKCGDMEYNPETQFCKEGDIWSRCEDTEFNTETHFCDEVEDDDHEVQVYAKCGGKKYNPGDICEDGKIYPGCGGSRYDPEKEDCCCGSTYNPKTHFCQTGDGGGCIGHAEPLCGGNSWNLYFQSCEKGKVKQRCGIESSNTYDPETQFCDNNNRVYNKCNGEEYDTEKMYCFNKTTKTEYGFVQDKNGNTYKTVKIGKQVWMAENLNYDTKDSYSKCYDNEEENCKKYGRLYRVPGFWEEGICPSGWHLPSEAEWEELMTATGGKKIAATKLKAVSGWNDYKGKSGNGEDTYGFFALPGGYYYDYSSFKSLNIGNGGYWWNSEEGWLYIYMDSYWHKSQDENLTGWKGYDYDYKDVGLSIRCVKD